MSRERDAILGPRHTTYLAQESASDREEFVKVALMTARKFAYDQDLE